MPAVSKAQFRFMGLVASGKKKVKGLSRKKAKEFLRGVHPKNLPARKKKKGYNFREAEKRLKIIY